MTQEPNDALDSVRTAESRAVKKLSAAGDRAKERLEAVRDEPRLETETRNIIGVRVPRSPFDRGYVGVDTSLSIDAAASAFEEEVETILQLAENELRLRRLSEEVHKITRKVNSLGRILIPRIQDEIEYTEMKLEERERERNYHLHLVMSKLLPEGEDRPSGQAR